MISKEELKWPLGLTLVFYVVLYTLYQKSPVTV